MSGSPEYERPADFKSFWQETLEELTAVDPDVELAPSALYSNDKATVYRVVSKSLGGVTLRGWLACPRVSHPTPALLILPGYTQALYPPRDWATEYGICALALSVRGHEGSSDEIHPGFPGTLVHGVTDKFTYIYRGIFCDAWRGVDILKTFPWVDASRIAVTGLSQGGALALISAARREVVAVAADVPFLCDIYNAVNTSHVYPYEEIHDLLSNSPQDKDKILNVLRYFDVLGFADDIHCPVLMSVGLKDRKAPPELSQRAFERLQGSKEWAAYDDAGHEGGGWRHEHKKTDWLKYYLEPHASSEKRRHDKLG